MEVVAAFAATVAARGREDHVHPALNQIRSQVLESVLMTVGAMEFNG
jgi:hypothetical protein